MREPQVDSCFKVVDVALAGDVSPSGWGEVFYKGVCHGVSQVCAELEMHLESLCFGDRHCRSFLGEGVTEVCAKCENFMTLAGLRECSCSGT